MNEVAWGLMVATIAALITWLLIAIYNTDSALYHEEVMLHLYGYADGELVYETIGSSEECTLRVAVLLFFEDNPDGVLRIIKQVS